MKKKRREGKKKTRKKQKKKEREEKRREEGKRRKRKGKGRWLRLHICIYLFTYSFIHSDMFIYLLYFSLLTISPIYQNSPHFPKQTPNLPLHVPKFLTVANRQHTCCSLYIVGLATRMPSWAYCIHVCHYKDGPLKPLTFVKS